MQHNQFDILMDYIMKTYFLAMPRPFAAIASILSDDTTNCIIFHFPTDCLEQYRLIK